MSPSRFFRLLPILLLFATLGAGAETPRAPLTPLAEPFAAPGFTLPGDNGATYRLEDYRGKLVILNFWATWCPPCREEMPAMDRAWQAIKNDNIVMLAINVGEDSDTIFEFTGRYPVSFPLPMDRNGEVIARYPVRGLPTTYIISPQGQVTHRAVGTREWDSPAMLDQLRTLARHSNK